MDPPTLPSPLPGDRRPLELSILVLAKDEAANLGPLLSSLRRVADQLGAPYEMVVVDGNSTDATAEIAARSGARVVTQTSPGYGGAISDGMREVRGEYVATMDADQSHDPAFLAGLFKMRRDADLVIASRYVWFGHAQMGLFRYVLSRILNGVYRRLLSLPVHDLSSGFRLYRRRVFEEISISRPNFDCLLEIVVKMYAEGFRILEVPFHYLPRIHGTSHVRLLRFGMDYLRTLVSLWRLRHSVASADYDARGFHSLVPPQRYWQRRRYDIVRGFLDPDPSILDIGCGSSMIIISMPQAVGLDTQHRKLRYLRRLGPSLVAGSLTHLPFADQSFGQVVCSEVIEHIPRPLISFSEMDRVLRPGGTLVVGTPDYGRLWWPMIEAVYRVLMPGGYADEHVTHFTHDGLRREIEALGYTHLATRTILGAEMVLKFRKLGALRAADRPC